MCLNSFAATQADNLWPWSEAHTAQSWRERYVKKKEHFDKLINEYVRANEAKKRQLAIPVTPRREFVHKVIATSGGPKVARPCDLQKTPFTQGERLLLVAFLAENHPEVKGRFGPKVYQDMLAEVSVLVVDRCSITDAAIDSALAGEVAMGTESSLVIVARTI